MNTLHKNLFAFIASVAASVALTQVSSAQTVYSPISGLVKLPALANSDTVVAPPLERASEYEGTVASFSSGNITVSGSPAWTANQFLFNAPSQPKTYYLRVRTGTKAGAFYTVVGNSAGTVTLDLSGDTLTGLAAGDRIAIIPFWTLGTLFPAADAGVSFEASANALLRKTEIFFYDQNFVGVNAPPTAIYFFTSGAWRKIGQPVTTSFDNTVVLPDSFFRVRNKTLATNLTVVGSVLADKTLIGMNSYQTAKQDNNVALTRPIDVSLNDSGLISSGAFAVTTNTLARKDELYVYDNSVAGLNKPLSAIYFYFNGAWRKIGQPVTTDFGSDLVFKAGTGVIIRKAGNGTGPQTSNWVNTATY